MRQPGSVAVPFFVEEQHFRQWWLWLILVGPLGVIWYGFWRQIILGERFGNRPAPDWIWWILFLVLGVGLPWLLYSARMVTVVRADSIVLRFATNLFPLFRKTIPVGTIQSAEAVTYRPIREYGGWGVRWGGKGWAYSVSGNRGVQLTLAHGKGILLGSHDADRLALAIQQAIAGQSRSV